MKNQPYPYWCSLRCQLPFRWIRFIGNRLIIRKTGQKRIPFIPSCPQATYGPRLSTAQRATIFSQGAAYIVGGQRYSADDMEHGVLRGNKAGAASLAALLGKPEWGRGPFGEGDPRLTQVRCV